MQRLMIRFWRFMGVLLVALLAGCGGSHAVQGGSVSLHIYGRTQSPPRRYSVAQVKRAFADQGIRLHRVEDGQGRVLLSTVHAAPRRGVQVEVETGPPAGATLVLLGQQKARQDNVRASSDDAEAGTVRAALHELH